MNLTTQDRCHLAKDAYKDRSQEASATNEEDRVVTAGVQNYRIIAYANARSGYQGTAYRDLSSGEVVIANRGTEFNRELIRDVVLADGGMVAKAANAQVNDGIAFAQLAIEKANEWAASNGKSAPAITAVGHSLGGTLAQIQTHHVGIRLKVTAGDARPAAGPAPGAWRSDIHSLHRSSTHR